MIKRNFIGKPNFYNYVQVMNVSKVCLSDSYCKKTQHLETWNDHHRSSFFYLSRRGEGAVE